MHWACAPCAPAPPARHTGDCAENANHAHGALSSGTVRASVTCAAGAVSAMGAFTPNASGGVRRKGCAYPRL